MIWVWRGFLGLGALAFAAFAAVQWNDPDPWGWLAVYLLGSAACILAWSRPRGLIPGVVLGVSAVWALTLIPDVDWGAAWMPQEAAREAGGLLLLALWMVPLLAQTVRSPRAQASEA
jgi:hypothetical protein